MCQLCFKIALLILSFSGDPDFPESFAQKGKVEPSPSLNVSGLGRGSYLVNRPSKNPGSAASNPNRDIRNNIGIRSSTWKPSSQEEIINFPSLSETNLHEIIQTRREEDFTTYQNSFSTFPHNEQRKQTPEQSSAVKLPNTKQGCDHQTKVYPQSRVGKLETRATTELGLSVSAQPLRPNFATKKSTSCDSSTAFVTEQCSTTPTILRMKESSFRPISTPTRRAPGDSVRSVAGLGRAELIQRVKEKRMNSSK